MTFHAVNTVPEMRPQQRGGPQVLRRLRLQEHVLWRPENCRISLLPNLWRAVLSGSWCSSLAGISVEAVNVPFLLYSGENRSWGVCPIHLMHSQANSSRNSATPNSHFGFSGVHSALHSVRYQLLPKVRW
jgi:hypothetical protein